jgi:hypothetical protein
MRVKPARFDPKAKPEPEKHTPIMSDAQLAAMGLPERCYVWHPEYPKTDARAIAMVERGRMGYVALVKRPGRDGVTVEELNAEIGVTTAQARAMLMGSMFGWHTPGAHPKHQINNR